MDLTPYLKLMADKNASDLFFSAGTAVNIKIEGVVQPVGKQPLLKNDVKQLAYSIMTDHQIKEFEAELEMNFAISISNIGRFRANIYRQRGSVAMVMRYIKHNIPSIEALNLPVILKKLVMEPRGLILVVGSTGSGKSTTLASMVDYRNSSARGHILTIEDPIEFVHEHKKSIVDQREIGLDTLSYANALKNAMREAPDVILIGEIRDKETMQHAIAYAETGHLCLATLHASNAYQSIERIFNFFDKSVHEQLCDDLSLNLRAVISQRLLIGNDKKRIAATEIMLNSPYISDLIKKGEIEKIRDAMEKNKDRDMQTFDDSVYELYETGKVSLEEALRNADSKNNLQIRIRLSQGTDGIEEGDDLKISQENYKA